MGIFTPKWKNKDPQKRIEAILKLKNISAISKIAENDIDVDVRKVAYEKLEKSVDLWGLMAEDKTTQKFLFKNVGKISGQQTLAKIAKSKKVSRNGKIAAIKYLTDIIILSEISKSNTAPPEVRKAASLKLKDLNIPDETIITQDNQVKEVRKESPLQKYSANNNDKPVIKNRNLIPGSFGRIDYHEKAGVLIASSNVGYSINVVKPSSGKIIKEFKNDYMNDVFGIHASLDTDDFVIYGASDPRFYATSIRILNLNTDNKQEYTSHKNNQNNERDRRTFTFDASFKKSLAASAGLGNEVFVYNLKKEDVIRKLATPLSSCVHLLADKQQVLVSGTAGDNDASVELWDILKNKCLRKFKGRKKLTINSIDVSPDGDLLIGAGATYVWLWNFNTGQLLDKYMHGKKVVKTQFIRGGKSFCSMEKDGKLRFWNVGNKSSVFTIEDYTKYLTDIYINKGGTLVYASSYDEGILTYEFDWVDPLQEQKHQSTQSIENEQKESRNNKQKSKYFNKETKGYALSINIANVMGHQVSAKFNGTSDVDNEKQILKHFAFSDVLDEIPEAFKMCNIYIGKLVDIQEAAAIMCADMEGVPSANVRVDEEGSLSFQGKEGDVKSCQNTGELSWAGGSCKLTRTLFPSSQKEKYYLVVVNS